MFTLKQAKPKWGASTKMYISDNYRVKGTEEICINRIDSVSEIGIGYRGRRTDLKAFILFPSKSRTIVHVFDEKGAGLIGVEMDPATSVTESTCCSFKMKGTVSFILPQPTKKHSEWVVLIIKVVMKLLTNQFSSEIRWLLSNIVQRLRGRFRGKGIGCRSIIMMLMLLLRRNNNWLDWIELNWMMNESKFE